VRTMLGTLPRERLVGLVEALAAGDGAGLLGQVEELAEQCADFPSVLAELLVLLHRVALIRQVPGAIEEDDRDAVAALAERLAPEDVQLFYQIALLGRRDLPLAPDPRAGFDGLTTSAPCRSALNCRWSASRPEIDSRITTACPYPSRAAWSGKMRPATSLRLSISSRREPFPWPIRPGRATRWGSGALAAAAGFTWSWRRRTPPAGQYVAFP
ncbi:MAG TPA: hypothetical protein ENG91_04430, partial [Desulfobacteraceae bacterium]|nr:hypothetical protein [Desulfobacteraceae bacterium]